MKFEHEFERLMNLYVVELRGKTGDLMANIAKVILQSFLDWYKAP